MSVERLNQIWPEWQIEANPIGKGAFGVVYKAVRRDYNVESHAAIKEISIPSDPSEIAFLRSEGLDRNAAQTYLKGIVDDFVGEIQLMESLKSAPNIVGVEDYKVVEKTGELGWEIYIRMELLTPFSGYSTNKKLTEEEVIKLGCDICTALEICEKRNILHRDIKPENIFVNEFGYFKLGDFGIARKMENMTGGLSQKGTPFYMAPEVVSGDTYDARVDIYSLGLVLYRLMNNNRFPFLDTEQQLLHPAERQNALMRRLRGEALPAPCDASPAMTEAILRACAYRPEQRFASAAEMKQALMQAANGVCPTALSGAAAKTAVSDNANETVAVRKASAGQSGVPVRSAHWTEKKPKAFLRIAAILMVCLLIGIGIFAGFLLGGGNTSAGNPSSGVIEYTGEDAEQIAVLIGEAEALAAEKDYEGALAKIQSALTVYPGAAELTAKAKVYEDACVDCIMTQNDAYIKADDYAAAETAINEALVRFPDNAVLLARSEALKNSKPQLMLQVCPPYQTTMGYRARENYTMGGKAYANGFNLHYNSNGAAYFNLEQKYRLLSFDVGHIDGGLQQTGRYDFYLDGVLVKSLVLEPSMMVQRVDIPVRGASQLLVKAGKWCDYYALVNITLTPDVPVK